MKNTLLSRFTPSLMAPETLEAIFVQRHQLADYLVEVIRESALTANKHFRLLVGMRGIGKSHMIALIYHRVSKMDDLQDKLLIAWLREEEWGVTSFLELLLRIFRSLQEEYPAEYNEKLNQQVKALYQLSPEEAEHQAAVLLRVFVEKRTLLLLIENLDDVFNALGEIGQKQLRAYIQNYSFLTILATTQSLFDGVRKKDDPFYNFFHPHLLEDLKLNEAINLLRHIAKLEGDSELEYFIQTSTGQERIQAVHHLAGGNPRVYVIFSRFLSRKSLDELVEAFMQMLDDLTPYYQQRMACLSQQQRKIIEFLSDRRHAVTVKEIAQYCFITHQTASSQLRDLKEKGYVRSEAIGRESFYELRESLMRFCMEVKKQRGQPIRLFVDFLRLWYTQIELQQRLELLSLDSSIEKDYVLYALKLVEEEIEDPRVAACLEEYKSCIKKDDLIRALQPLNKLVKIRGKVEDWFRQGYCLARCGYLDEALISCDKAIKIDPKNSMAWGIKGRVLEYLNRYDEALKSFKKAVELDPNNSLALEDQGITMMRLRQYDQALISFDKVIELEPSHAPIWTLRGIVLSAIEHCDRALISLNKAVELDASDSLAWNVRGRILIQSEQYDEALASFNKAIELNPNDTQISSRQVALLLMMQHWEEAAISLKRAVLLDPKIGLFWQEANKDKVIIYLWQKPEKTVEEVSSKLIQGKIDITVQWKVKDFENLLSRYFKEDKSDVEKSNIVAKYLRSLLKRTSDAETWYLQISNLLKLYDEQQKDTSSLKIGLVRCIDTFKSPVFSNATAQAWRDTWEKLVGKRDEFQLPLRLLDTAVRYRDRQDRRILLELPIEERELLKPLLGVDVEHKE
ncbi:HTH arsR-type domain-containing protein [Nostoc sp. DSM 114161]|jgi:tetratricopeptide (TPR) repeat protein|uniref:tetratricopeptide repeat protein n=1 Tax=Nostoc sp. DSM 114161 TaxID=3440143 RepID=UPI004045C424